MAAIIHPTERKQKSSKPGKERRRINSELTYSPGVKSGGCARSCGARTWNRDRRRGVEEKANKRQPVPVASVLPVHLCVACRAARTRVYGTCETKRDGGFRAGACLHENKFTRVARARDRV